MVYFIGELRIETILNLIRCRDEWVFLRERSVVVVDSKVKINLAYAKLQRGDEIVSFMKLGKIRG
jgi:hypothetical protein|tara:strand:+ start:896 stop:1090 length:195 start_codon:yes stop_codon:yes gene_type:complete